MRGSVVSRSSVAMAASPLCTLGALATAVAAANHTKGVEGYCEASSTRRSLNDLAATAAAGKENGT